MRLAGFGVLLCSAVVFADPVADALSFLRQTQSPGGDLGSTTNEPALLATSEAVVTWRALGLESSAEAQAALVFLATSPAVDDRELEGRRSAALRGTPWSFDFDEAAFASGFSADEPAVLGWSLSTTGSAGAVRARRLLALALPNGCYAYADNSPDAALTAQAALHLVAFESDPVVAAGLSSTRACLLAAQRPDGSFGTASATALSVLALQRAGAAVSGAVGAARAALVATQQSNGSWGSVRATALALRALGLSGPDWQVVPDERGRPVLALYNPNPLAGESVGASLDLRNNSTSPAPAMLVRFTAVPVNGPEIPLVDTTVSALAAGERATVSASLPTSSLQGRYTIRARVDPLQVVAEPNEADNEATAPLNVRSELDLSLSADSIRFIPTGPGQVDVLVDVRALGGNLAVPVQVDVYAGRAPTTSLIGSVVIAQAIPVNGTATATVHWSTSGVNGATPVTAIVDPGQQVAEADELNNAAFRYYFAGSGRPVDVSLVAADVTSTPTSPQRLTPVTLSATVRNLAAADALDVAVVVASSTGELLATTELPLVPAGGAATAQLTFTPTQSGLLTLTVDPDQLLLDANRANNVTQRFLAVTEGVNLALTGLAADPATPGQRYNVGFSVAVTAGPPRSVTSVIKDLRTGALLYRNTDLIAPPGTTLTVRTLVGGEVAPMLQVCVDPDDELAESNENDNCQELTASSASTQLELDARRLNVAPVGPAPGERVSVTADVLNKSLLPAGVTVQWFLGPPTLPTAVPLGETTLTMVSAQNTASAQFDFVMPEGATPELHARLSRSTLRNAAAPARQQAGRHLFLESIIDVVQPDAPAGPFTEIDGTNIRVARLTPTAQPSLLVATEDLIPFRRGSLVALQRGADAGYAEQWRAQWPLKQVTSFAVADLNGDGSAELAVLLRSIGSDDNVLQVLDASGALRWSATLVGATPTTVAGELGLGDFNADGVTDLVLADGRLLVYSGIDGALIRNTEFTATRFVPAGSVVHVLDVDGDGNSEVFFLGRVAGGPQIMFVLNHDGTPRWSRDFGAQYGQPAIADLNGDGFPDVLLPRYSTQMQAFSLLDGQLLGGTTGSFETAVTPAMVGAFRQDGLPYLAVQSWGDHFGRPSGLDVFRSDFTRLYSAERPSFDHVEENLTLTAADLLGRGRPQVIGVSDVSAFFFWDSRQGQKLLAHPSPDTRGFGAHRYQSNISADTLQPPVVADLSADGGAFVVVGYDGVSAASPTQPNYGHGEALVFTSAHWKRQPPVWAERQVVPGRITADLRVHENYRWWVDHNTWNSQFDTSPATLLADLTPQAPAAPPTPTVGAPTTLSATIRNVGGVAAGNFDVAFFDGAPDAGRLIGATSVVGPLAPRGGAAPASVAWTPTVEGAHQVVVVVNRAGSPTESGLENNEAQARVLVASAATGCDLQVNGISVTPTPGVAGGVLQADVAIANVGDATCPPSSVSLYRGSPSLGDLVGEVTITSLAPAAATSASFSSPALPGTFVFTALADEANVVPDVRRSNNQVTAVHSTPQGSAPDLVLVSAGASPSPAFPGESVVLSARVRNVGTPSTAATLVARVGADIRGTATIPPLLVGETIDVPLEVTAGAVTETYQLEADATNSVAELSEVNNTGTVTLPVQPRSLSLAAALTPSSAGPGTPIDVLLSVGNTGGSASEVLVSAVLLDPSGTTVAQLLSAQRLVVPSAQTSLVHASFDTGLLPPGQYQLRATGSSAGRGLLPALVAFTVLPEQAASVGLIADKATYHQGDAVLLRERATNLSRNQGLGPTTLELTVRDQSNVVVFASTRQLAALPPRGVFDAADVYALSLSLPPGAFTVTSAWHQGLQPLSAATTAFTVEYVASEAVRGTLSAVSPFPLGPPLAATIEVTNTGALALTGGQLEVDLLSAVDLHLESQSFQSLTLAAGASRTLSLGVPTAGVTEGMKLLVLRLDGRILDRTGAQATTSVDVDPPLIDVTGVFDGQLTNQAVSPVITVMDASALVVTTLLDGQPFVSGTSIHQEGGHTLTVDAVDFYGNAAHTVVRFTQDFVPPVLSLAGVAHGAIQRTPATLTYSASDAHPGTTTSTVDGVAFVSGNSVSAEGDHLWSVSSTDAAGNTASQSRSFSIDLTAPVITFTGVTPGEYRNTPVTPVVAIAEPHPGSVSALLDGQPYTLGTPVSSDGTHTLAVAAVDLAGNLGQAEITFTIATQPPVITITGVTQGATVHGPVTLSFTVSGTQPITATATLDGAPFTSGASVSAEGPHTLAVSSVDAAGNHASATLSFTIDTIPPVITVGGITEGALYGQGVNPTFGASDLHLTAVSANLDGSAFSSGSAVATDGPHTLTVVASDAAGNSSQTVVTFTVDRTAPVIAISGVAQGTTVSGSVTPGFTVTDASTFTLAVTLDGAPFSPGTTITAEGAHTLVATATDAAGNVGTSSRSFAIDRTAPVITIAGVTEGGVTSVATPVVTVSDASSVTTTVTLNGQPFVSGTTVGVTGQYILVVSAIDAAGNTASATRHFEVVSMRPTFGYAACAFGTLTLLNNAQVNLADGGTAPASAAAHGATVLMNNARVRGDLVSGGAFTAKNNARVDGKLYSGSTVTLQNNATVAGGLQPVTPAPHPCECGFDVAARVQDALAHNDDQLLPAGFRGPALVVQNGQSLQLPAGRFAFTSVTVGNNASVTAASGAAVELYVSGAVSVSNNAFLGAAAGQPPLLLVSSGAAVTLANNAIGALQVYAPSADLDLGNNSEVQGAVVGHNITLRNNQQVRLVGAQSVPPPLTCQ